MMFTLGEVRKLISEAFSEEEKNLKTKFKRINQFVVNSCDTAQDYVSSVAAGTTDGDTASELQKISKQLDSYVKFLKSHNDKTICNLEKFSQILKEIAEMSEFWNRPSFIGKKKYAFSLASKLNDLLSLADVAKKS